MMTFDDIVSDLRNESLLDEWFNSPFEKDNHFIPTQNSIDKQIKANTITKNSFESTKDYELNLPNFNFLKTEKLPNDSDENKSPKIETQPTVTVSSATPSTRIVKTRKRITKKGGKGGNYCKNCAVKMPFYYLRCKYCHEKVVGNLYLYLLIILSSFIFVMIVLLIVTSKNYK